MVWERLRLKSVTEGTENNCSIGHEVCEEWKYLSESLEEQYWWSKKKVTVRTFWIRISENECGHPKWKIKKWSVYNDILHDMLNKAREQHKKHDIIKILTSKWPRLAFKWDVKWTDNDRRCLFSSMKLSLIYLLIYLNLHLNLHLNILV